MDFSRTACGAMMRESSREFTIRNLVISFFSRSISCEMTLKFSRTCRYETVTFCRAQLQVRSILPAKRRSSCRTSGVRLQLRENFPAEPYGKRSLIESAFSAVKRKLSCRAPGRTLHTQSSQALLLGLVFNFYRLWRPAF